MSRPHEGAIPFRAIEREFFRFVKDVFQSGPAPQPATRAARPEPGPFAPPADLYETPEETVVVVELPGVDPATVEISAEGGVLTVRGAKPADAPGEPTGPGERRFGPFERKVRLTREVDLDAARAEGRHGVLTIRLPRPPAQKPRTIPIQAG